MLSIQSVTKTYGKKDNKFTALDNVSADFEAGTTNAIIGKSGSGKSTMLHIMTGLDRPSSGDIKDGEASIFQKTDTDKWRGENVGIIFQSFFLQGNDSVVENVALPLKLKGVNRRARNKQAMEALEQVGLLDKAKNKAKDLSGGQKQRVAIARALVTKPKILVADEPTGNLDSENGAAVENLLFELNQKLGTTLLIVTHDLDLAKRCSRVIFLKDGQVKKDIAKKHHDEGEKNA